MSDVESPRVPDLFEQGCDVQEADHSQQLLIAVQALADAAYWRGRHEVLESFLVALEKGHAREIVQIAAVHDDLVSYLKDRLDRLEVCRDEPSS